MNNIGKIQEKLASRGLDGLLITEEKNQRYASGFPFSDGAVLVGREKAWLITDSRYIEAAEKAAGAALTVQLYDRQLPLKELLCRDIKEAGMESLAAEEGKLSFRDYREYEKALGLELRPCGGLLQELRASKSEEELKYMQQAQDIAELALEDVLHIIRPGMTERQVMAELVYSMLRHGSQGNSFDMPHGVPGDKVIKAGDFVTMDFGCIKGGYCSDMTRTVAVGRATEEMKQVYDIVLKAQLAGIAAARAGIPGRDIDAAARKVIEAAGYGAYFGHGFGHSLGLDIHEGPSANPSGLSPMPEGAVCSAEPGIYLPGRFGVRIEDVMVLEKGGCRLLTRAKKELLILPA